MMFKDMVKTNRSYRTYDESYRFTKEQLTELVDLTRYCASSVNLQALKYHLVYENEELARLQAQTKWAAALKDMTLPPAGKCPTAWVVICVDKNISDNVARWGKDIGIAAQTMLLAAVEQGLGGCMIGNFKPEAVKAELGLPENAEPALLVALGKPAETIVVTEIEDGEKTTYYRDENGVHYVPKRKLKDILI